MKPAAAPPPTPTAGWELTRYRPIRALLARRSLNWAAMTAALGGLLLAILAGLLGTAAGSANFGIVFVWIVWWGLLMTLLLPLGGRLWCLVCPIPAAGEWLQRGALVDPPSAGPTPLLQIAPARSAAAAGGGMGRSWPRRWQGIWLQNAGFLAVALFSTVILSRPAVTGGLLLAFLLAALVLAAIFEHRSFCRYVCPVGGFIGLYALISPLELRVRDPLVCQGHRTKDCALGSAAGYGCPWLLTPWSLERNAACGLCGECFRTCPKENVAVRLRWPGRDLLVASAWRLDEAYKACIMLSSAAIYPLVLLGPWGRLKAWANLETLSGFAAYAAAFLLLSLGLLPGLHLALAAVVRRAAGLAGVSLGRLFVALAYPLIPLGLAAWVAFTLAFVFANAAYALPVLSDPFGWGWDLFGTAGVAWRPLLPGWAPRLQALVLLLGLVGSIVAADGVLRRLGDGRRSLAGLAAAALLLTAETIGFLWLYLGALA